MAQEDERETAIRRARGTKSAIVQRRVMRKDGWTKEARSRFLEVLRSTANVREAARAVGKRHCGAYALRKRDPGFAALWIEALEQGYAELEMMLIRHSLFGTERTELIREGGSRHGRVKATKTVHSFPLATAMQLHRLHARHVGDYRIAQALERPNDAAVIDRVRLAMADIRARLEEGSDAGADAGAGGAALRIAHDAAKDAEV